jgi:hypothetical protein
MRPFAITVISWLFIALGIIGLVRHGPPAFHSFHQEDVWILLSEVLAIVGGVFMLRGADWARWLAVVWAAAHVAIGWLNGRTEAVIHALIFLAIAMLLFRADARGYFRPRPAGGGAGA